MSATITKIDAVPKLLGSPQNAEGHISTAELKHPLTGKGWANSDKPKVLIVGAGIGGLLLGNLLQKANVPFLIVEKAREVKPLAGSGVSQLFQQLGILQELMAIGKPYMGLEVFCDDRQPLFRLDSSEHPRYCGSLELIVARPDLHDLLLRQVPKDNIHMGKKMLSFDQNDQGVTIRCSDESTYHGDILVGADGAHSVVREHLFKLLKGNNQLPRSDDDGLPSDCVCLVGQTEVLDPKDFPEMKLSRSKFDCVLDDEYVWATVTTFRNSICWIVVQHLNSTTSKSINSSRSSDWSSEAAEAMCNQVRHFQIPGGKDGNLTLGNIIDRTPKDRISKVMLEEKIFSTWHEGRTVLLGDACHKLNPYGGAGALTAMHDAVALANWISTLQRPKLAEIEKIFAEYQAERLPAAKDAASRTLLFKRMGGKGIAATLSRSIFRHMPRWLLNILILKMVAARPQVSFLPLVKDTGSSPPKHQPSLKKTLAIHKTRAAKGQFKPSSAVA
ncbi:hypothetical protein CPC16_006107 [Podila verticillata]|nr:hypothetical protein CPC16_006107 [Podila verticillata]